MGRNRNPPPKQRAPRRRSTARFAALCGAVAVLCAAVAWGVWRGVKAASRDSSLLERAAKKFAAEDLRQGASGFSRIHNKALLGLELLHAEGWKSFEERWESVGEAGRIKYLQKARQRVRMDPLFRKNLGTKSHGLKQMAIVGREFFATDSLATEKQALQRLFGQLLLREENNGYMDSEVESFVLRQLSGDQPELQSAEVMIRLALRSVLLTKSMLLLAVEVLGDVEGYEEIITELISAGEVPTPS